MKPRIQYIILIILIFTLSCGFKPLNYNSNYKIIDIETKGDNKINFILKNKINLNKNIDNPETKNVKLEILSEKTKIVKEKNIQNQITKYSLIIKTNFTYIEVTSKIKEKFSITKSGDYSVATNHSQTITNEKNLLNLLVNSIAEEFNRKLIINFSDI